MQIGNKDPVPGSCLNIIGFIIVFLVLSFSSPGMALNDSNRVNVIFLHIMKTVRLM